MFDRISDLAEKRPLRSGKSKVLPDNVSFLSWTHSLLSREIESRFFEGKLIEILFDEQKGKMRETIERARQSLEECRGDLGRSLYGPDRLGTGDE